MPVCHEVPNFVAGVDDGGNSPIVQRLGSKLCFSPYKTEFCPWKSDLPTAARRW